MSIKETAKLCSLKIKNSAVRFRFKSQCRNPFTKKREHLGYFTCEQEAHQAWLKRKLELAKELAFIYKTRIELHQIGVRDKAKKVGGYDPDLFLVEDYDYWIRIAKYAELFYYPDTMYQCRKHPGSLTATRQKEIRYRTSKLWLMVLASSESFS